MNTLFPLADKLRPASLEDFVGQLHLTGQGKLVHTLIENKKLNSLIIWGPPGTGKTTLSRIIVKETEFSATEFSATISRLNDVREVMKQAAEVKKMTGNPLVLFVDEIHHFNKSAQDAFLPYVERGDIILLGTTTENPAYKINRALLSRLKILEFFPLQREHLLGILRKGVETIKTEAGVELSLPEVVEDIIIHYANGDARRLLNLLELIYQYTAQKDAVELSQPGEADIQAGEADSVGTEAGELTQADEAAPQAGEAAPPGGVAGAVTEALVLELIQERIGSYDRKGEDRYQLISAFHKSVRNSDMDAALFWLYRMLEGGEDPLFILRRMIRIAAEDIGFADPEALQVCLNAKSAFEFLGQPEGDLFLAQAAVYLTSAPKSNALYKMEKTMRKLADKYKGAAVPMHILNASNFVAAKKGAGKEYLYAHDFREKTTPMSTMPMGVEESGFYQPNSLGFEKKIKERMDYWLKLKAKMTPPRGEG
ncbi:MAG: replication-associated recombination protein A [bacterium]|nr:replication-associated recombination protein A [bacterium]